MAVRLMASKFQMAYLPSSVLNGSSAAMELSSSSKADTHSQPFFLQNCCCSAILLRGWLSTVVTLKHVLLVDGPGFAERQGATDNRHNKQHSSRFDHKSNCHTGLRSQPFKKRFNPALVLNNTLYKEKIAVFV